VPSEDRNLGMVYQSYALWPHMNVFENVAYPLKVRRTPKEEIKKRVAEVLKLLEIFELQDRIPAALSGGQQQRVALARALIYNPEILLLDEPLSNLDEQLRLSVRDDLKTLQRRIGITTIYVTHDRVEALSLSDKIILMSKGKLEVQGVPRELLEKPPNSYAASFLGGMLVLDGKIVSTGRGAVIVETEFGQIESATEDSTFQKADAIKACIKSSALYAVDDPSQKKNTISGQVKGLTMDTEKVWYRVSIEGQTVMVPKRENDISRNTGDTMYFHVPESAVYLVRS
jgi:iron(III) transport system ATP-binding protein